MSNIETTYRSIISLIIPVGERLCQKAEKQELSQREKVAYDILKRIKGNLEVLSVLPFNENSAVSIKLIIRSIFSDLISGLYLLSRSDEELSEALFRLDYEHFLSMKNWAECHDNLDNSLNLIQHLNKTYKDFIIRAKHQEWKRLSIFNMSRELKKMNGNIRELGDLYSEYRLLSQTEHYSLKGARFSYIQEFDKKLINTKYIPIIEYSIKHLINLIPD